MRLTLPNTLPEHGKPWVVCGNLPTTLPALVLKTCSEAQLLGAVFSAKGGLADYHTHGNKDYSLLSVLVQSQFDAQVSRFLPAGCFVPPPKVESAVVVLKKNDKGFDTTEKRVQLKKIVKQAFSQRRKTLKNNFKKHPDIREHLEAMGVDLGLRPEALPVSTYMMLTERLLKKH